MTIIMLCSLPLLLLLIYHCSVVYGRSATIRFFSFLILWAIAKEFIPSPGPYGFPVQTTNVVIGKLTVSIGWIITFYLGWSISDLILRRNKSAATLLQLLIVGAFVIASIAYAMEAVGTKVGWWYWNRAVTGPQSETMMFPFIVTSFRPIQAWTYFGVHFLIAFYLIQYSKYNHKLWRYLFYFFPFTAIITIPFPHIDVNFMLLFLYACIIFHKDLFNKGIDQRALSSQKHIFVDYIPSIVFSSIIIILLLVSVLRASDSALFIALLPAILLLSFSITRLSHIVIAMIIMFTVFLIQEKSIPIIVTWICVFGIHLISLFRIKKANNYT